jgi:hypothetical protein
VEWTDSFFKFHAQFSLCEEIAEDLADPNSFVIS